jgi:uncharacterized repeat protein (TIGR04076 family)
METKQYKVVIKLVGNQMPCHIGHQVGDEWVFDYMTPGGICSLAYNAIYPIALALQFGATFPWQDDPDVIQASCPDAEVNNVFELRRVPKE